MAAAEEYATPPDHPEIMVFWDAVRNHAGLNDMAAYMGPSSLESIPPPAWSYGQSSEEADEFVNRVIGAGATQIVTPMEAYTATDEDLPVAGTLSILCDGTGRPRVLLVDSVVEEVEADGV